MYEYLLEKGKEFPILYVEDNDGLREKAVRFFKKFFPVVYVGKDGLEGLELFKKYQPKIVISDIKMPKLDGLEMSKEIKNISPNVKIIITTAHNEKNFLLNAIEIGIFRYLNKPFNIQEITDILTKSIQEIEHQDKLNIFNQNIKDIFNHQDNLLALIENDKPTIVNYNFMQFFDIKDVSEFLSKYTLFSDIFQEHKDFLYGKDSLEKIKESPQSLFNVKLEKNYEYYHFILKVKELPDKEDQYIYSLSDITELGLLKTFSNSENNDKNIITLLETVKNNQAKLKIHNYYKGLSITNETEVLNIDENCIEIKVNYLQSKAIQYEKQFILSSSFLPKSILCKDIANISYTEQSVTANRYIFINHTPIDRKYTRVMPDKTNKATLFYDFKQYTAEVRDISLKGTRLRMEKFPSKLKVDDTVKLEIILGKNKNQFLLECEANIIRIDKINDNLQDIALMITIKNSMRKNLIDYISKRQLALIREFKGLDKEQISG